jgi:hypothetical protein
VWRKKRWGNCALTHGVAVVSGGELLLEDEGVELDLFPGLDSDEEGWWWSATVRSKAGRGMEQSEKRAPGSKMGKWELYPATR